MADSKNYRFETLQLHVGQEQADPATDSRAVPIYQTTSYVFHNFDHAEARFGLADPGNIYGRLTNSTQGVFEDRIAALEGGTAGLAVASGAAAVEYAVRNITQSGDHIVAAKNVYGGTFNLLRHTLPRDGITTTFVSAENPQEFEDAIQENTQLVYFETFGNPNAALPCRALGQVLVATINRPASATQAERYRTCLYPLINRWNHWLSPLPQPLKKPFGTIRHAEVPHAGDPP